jgi:hypothetical protein
VSRAARTLNRAGVGVHLRRARSRAAADVVVAFGGKPCEGEAIGFYRRGVDLLNLGARCSRALVTLTAVHEFSHVLGLDHESRRCARMNASFDDSGTPDLRGLRAIYD